MNLRHPAPLRVATHHSTKRRFDTIEEQEPQDAIESAIAKLNAGTVQDLTTTETQLLLEFTLHPESFSPAFARGEAIDRLNELDPFSIDPDPEEE